MKMNDTNKNLKRQSKLLSLILRHDPAKAGLELGEGGWVRVDDLLKGIANMGRGMSRARLEEVVAENDKKRFTLSDDGEMIRAAQGHSVEIALNLQPKLPPPSLYHGTATRFLEAILEDGLKPMSRQHVHLSQDVETAVKVGSRHGKPVVLIIDTRAMRSRGMEFYQADNGVWLTNAVSPEYFERMEWKK